MGYSRSLLRALTIAQILEEDSVRAVARAIAVARTGFWLEQLAMRTNKFTPYALGKHLQPHTYRKNENNDAFHHNLWAKYARGEVVPSKSLLLAVEEKVPGSYSNFRHVLFEALNSDVSIEGVGDQLLRRTHPGVQRALFEPSPLERGLTVRRKSLARMLYALECRGHLDALAATIVLLREALAAGREAEVFEVGIAAHRALLVACAIGPGVLVDFELIVLVQHLVLRRVHSLGRCFASTIHDLCRQAAEISMRLLMLEDLDVIGLRQADSLKAAGKMFRGDYGDHLMYGLMPRLGMIGDPNSLPLKSRQDLLRDEVLGGWARDVLASNRVERIVPMEVDVEFCNRWDALSTPVCAESIAHSAGSASAKCSPTAPRIVA